VIARPWLILGAGLACVGLLVTAYVKGRTDGRAVEIAARQAEDVIRMETLQLAQQAAAEEIAKIEVKHVTVRQRLETEIREKPVYRDCVADQRVLDLTNEAITGHPAADPGELPAAGPDDGPDVR
jgi:hypothetical protein